MLAPDARRSLAATNVATMRAWRQRGGWGQPQDAVPANAGTHTAESHFGQLGKQPAQQLGPV